MNGQAEPEIMIGRIVAPFGLKGEVKVRLETDFPERLEETEKVWLKSVAGDIREVRIENVRFHKSQALVKFAGVDDIGQAEEMRGQELRIFASELRALPQGEFYIHDIVGLRAVTEEGEDLGEVTEVIRGPANDVYVTEKVLIPALKEVVQTIDLTAGKMVIRPIEGLMPDKDE